ncbi:MAG: PQQ-binding-like beta-propeller repeat protein [Verrucomicrobia bacterium]|nr:PQQ-binding-like beta-propeller repeat protein [Verrucomicrobiota bacterium]
MAFLKNVVALCLALAPLTATAAGVSFTKEIAPILQAKCAACHNAEKAKGHYQLHTFELMLKPGSSGSPALTPGKPEASELFRLLNEKNPDDRMPQKDDALSAKQIVLIEKWIREGAKFDGPDARANLATLIPQSRAPEAPKVYPAPVPISALAFSPDGKQIIAGGYYELTVWNVGEKKLLNRIKGAPQRTLAIAFSPDGKLLAVAGGTPGASGEVKLFNATSGKSVKTLSRLRDAALCLVFSPDGKTLAAGAADNTIRLYDMVAQKQRKLIEQHADWVLALAFNADGSRLASASRDKSARTFDAKSGALLDNYVAHEEPVIGVTFTAEGKIISAGRDRRVHAWEPGKLSEKDKKSKPAEFGVGEGELTRLLVTSNRLYAATSDRAVREYDPTKREIVRSFKDLGDEISALAFDTKGQRIAAGTQSGRVFIWKAEDGQKITSFTAAPGYKAPVASAK